MKRLAASLLSGVVVLGLAACGGGAATPAATPAPTVAPAPTSAPAGTAAAPAAPKVSPPIPLSDAKMQTTASGLKFADVTVGTGATPATTDWVTVNFTATLQDGTLFGASQANGGPVSVSLAEITKEVAGWGEGLSTMKVGGVRELVIPPNLAYGDKGVGPIPPGATLVFVVELLDTKPAPKVKIDDTLVGTGVAAADGMSVKVNYTGTLENGTVFDSSYANQQPLEFVLGQGQVIPGWEQGLQGMKVGGKRTLTIPSELGYGSRGSGPIPPNSNLIFEVELLDAQQPATPDPAAKLKVEDTVVGTGAEAVPGKTVGVYYTGKLQDGTVFDSNVGKTPMSFTVAAGQMIPGFDQGVQGMKVGGKRTITIPPALAYGAQGQGPIPPNATLIFDVELVDVK